MKELKSSSELQEHMLWTYYGLRVGLATIGIALPSVVWLGGVLRGVWFESSISAYYYTEPKPPWFTTRDMFVGGLLAISACLYLYKGFSNKENIALNLAGIFAVFVALLPTAAPDPVGGGLVSKLHGTSAVLFFACIAYVSLFRSRDTLQLLPQAQRVRYVRQYTATGVAMILSPAAAVLLSFGSGSQVRTTTFWVETLAVWSFAAYWIIKTREMRESSAERRALDAELKRDIAPAETEIPSDRGRVKASRGVERIVPEVR